MLMSVAEIARNAGMYPELAGARVLITGIGPTRGVDLVRAFGDHGCRMVLQIPAPCAETDALLAIIAESALDVHVQHDAIDTAETALKFTQSAAKVFGGFDVAVNLVAIDRADMGGTETLADVEEMIASRLQAAARATSVAANRMGLTWTHGSVLNILRMATPKTGAEAAVAGIARSALAAFTRGEAERWAGQGVRINAVAPRVMLGGLGGDDCLQSEPDVAALALYLASHDGDGLTGHVFDAEGAAVAI